jgi:4-amino-4-deoxy-L-arabinose transferase-like glycosyltransferase
VGTRHPALPEMLRDLMSIRDQVPFYYWVMRFWSKIGTDALILRLFSVYLGTASVAIVYQIGRRLDGPTTGLLAAFLLAISPFHIWYSQEVRMYALLPALLLLAHFCLLRLLERNRWQLWLLYGLAMTAVLYTHYFALFIVLVHTTFFVLHFRQIHRQTLSWLITMLAVGAAFAPWVYLVLAKTDGYGTAVPDWINHIQWIDLPLTFSVFAAGFGLGRASWLAALVAAIFLMGIGRSLPFLRKKSQQPNDTFCANVAHPPAAHLACPAPHLHLFCLIGKWFAVCQRLLHLPRPVPDHQLAPVFAVDSPGLAGMAQTSHPVLATFAARYDRFGAGTVAAGK